MQEPLPNNSKSYVAPGAAAEAFDTWTDGGCFSAAAPGDGVRVVMLRVWSAECVYGIQARPCAKPLLMRKHRGLILTRCAGSMD